MSILKVQYFRKKDGAGCPSHYFDLHCYLETEDEYGVKWKLAYKFDDWENSGFGTAVCESKRKLYYFYWKCDDCFKSTGFEEFRACFFEGARAKRKEFLKSLNKGKFDEAERMWHD